MNRHVIRAGRLCLAVVRSGSARRNGAWQLAQLPAQQALTQAAASPPICRGFAYQSAADLDPLKRQALLNSLAYRAKQRGFLELDLLMGDWAEQNLPTLSDAELTGFAAVLEAENPDLFKWLTGQEEPPKEMAENPAFAKLLKHVTVFLDENSQKATRGKLGKEWVRGWGDSGLPSSGNQQ